MERNNRINVRINGKDKPIENHPKKEMPSRKEAAASNGEKEFRWMLPEEKSTKKVVSLNDRQQQHVQRKKRDSKKIPKRPVHRKKTNSPLALAQKKRKQYALPKRQWLSALSAIVVGLMMGFVVLSIFTDHHMKPANTGNHDSIATETTATKGNGSTAATTNLNLSLAVIQGGVFSSESSGETAAENLKGEGFAAVLNQKKDKTHLFIGVGDNKDHTESLAKLYKQQGQDVWVKNLSIKANTNQLDHKIRTFLGNAKSLMKSLLTGSVNGLASDQNAFTKGQWNKLNKQFKQLQKEKGVADNQLMDDLKQAMTHAEKYRDGQKGSELWQVQQALLHATLSYQHLAKGKD